MMIRGKMEVLDLLITVLQEYEKGMDRILKRLEEHDRDLERICYGFALKKEEEKKGIRGAKWRIDLEAGKEEDNTHETQ